MLPLQSANFQTLFWKSTTGTSHVTHLGEYYLISMNTSTTQNWVWQCAPLIPALQRWRQKKQMFRNVILSYIVDSRPARAIWDCVSKRLNFVHFKLFIGYGHLELSDKYESQNHSAGFLGCSSLSVGHKAPEDGRGFLTDMFNKSSWGKQDSDSQIRNKQNKLQNSFCLILFNFC